VKTWGQRLGEDMGWELGVAVLGRRLGWESGGGWGEGQVAGEAGEGVTPPAGAAKAGRRGSPGRGAAARRQEPAGASGDALPRRQGGACCDSGPGACRPWGWGALWAQYPVIREPRLARQLLHGAGHGRGLVAAALGLPWLRHHSSHLRRSGAGAGSVAPAAVCGSTPTWRPLDARTDCLPHLKQRGGKAQRWKGTTVERRRALRNARPALAPAVQSARPAAHFEAGVRRLGSSQQLIQDDGSHLERENSRVLARRWDQRRGSCRGCRHGDRATQAFPWQPPPAACAPPVCRGTRCDAFPLPLSRPRGGRRGAATCV
jgi:hypothetical protein